MIEKHFVLDSSGKLKEVRGYTEGIVSERWEIVYDENDAVVGLRPLDAEELVPQNWLGRFKKLWRKPKPLSQILSIDFIGLIQYINTINKINTIKTIENIKNIESVDLIDLITLILEITNIKNVESIDLIDKIDEIGEITTIRDVTHNPSELILNPSFEQHFAGWHKIGAPEIDSSVAYRSGKSLKFPSGGAAKGVWQPFSIALNPKWWTEFYFRFRASAISVYVVRIDYYYTDGTSDTEQFSAAAGNTWYKASLSPNTAKKIESIYIYQNDLNVDLWVDAITLVL